ncbi:MAG: dienelactone hydrolase family protein [Verrucomicrobiota bacterium]
MKVLLIFSLLLFSYSKGLAQKELFEVRSIDADSQKEIKFMNPEYLLASPETDSKDLLPILIYLHGAGGRGDDIQKIRGQVGPILEGIAKFEKGPCLVVAPQCLRAVPGEENSIWSADDLNVFLKHLKATLPIDESRIFLTGNSMGGYGTWVWGATSPEHFAAIAPVSGGIGRGGPKDVTPEIDAWIKNLATIPVYAFVGASDKVVPPDRSQRLIDGIKNAGGNKAKIKVYPEGGHGVRGEVYATSEFYDWLFSKRRE